jgi:immunomodulating metalloprotease
MGVKKHFLHLIPVAGLYLLLAGCGGGGSTEGGNSSGSAGPVAGQPANSGSQPGTPPGGQTAAQTGVSAALVAGDAQYASTDEVMQAALALISGEATRYGEVKQALFKLNPDGTRSSSTVGLIDWDPSWDSSTFGVKDSARNHVILPSNWNYGSKSGGNNATLAVAGYSLDGKARYSAFGGNPLGVPGNANMDQFMVNVVSWLTARTDLANLKVVTAHLPGTETYWFPHEKKVRDWFFAKSPTATVNGLAAGATQKDNVCDGAALAGCLQTADLLVIGREQGPGAYDGAAVMQAVSDAQKRGIPVLYLHHYRDNDDLSARMLNYFGLSQQTNYWARQGLLSFEPAALPAVSPQLSKFQALLNRLNQNSFSTSWSGCSTGGRIDCSGDTAYMAEFGNPVSDVREMVQGLDDPDAPLFAQAGYQMEKLLVLLGDKYRAALSYPMTKSGNRQDFFRGLFSDMTVMNNRSFTTVAKNLGNFSDMFPAGTPTISSTVTTGLPASGSKQYMTGLYVMPGTKVTLTRTDGGSNTVRFGVNMLRDTTRVFNTYDRPSQISSQRFALQPNKPVTITSPYGGPLILFIDAPKAGEQSVSVKVDGVITHPVLRDAYDPVQVASFRDAVNTTPTNWIAFATDTLTVQSQKDKFKQTIANYQGNMSRLADYTFKYTIKDTYELAGFNASSGFLSLAPSAKAKCDSLGWDCTGTQHRRDTMQNVIVDAHAACGNGCSGNPYDQDWAFDPLGWGESHEIGHNLQVGRMKIYNDRSTEVSNNIFPTHKMIKYNQSPAGLAAPLKARTDIGFAVFTSMKTALAAADPVAAMYQSTWADGSYAANNSARIMFYRQLVEYARYYNSSYVDGWELFTLQYLLDRNMSANSGKWGSVAASYGFGTYASYPSNMEGNDFMLISSSFLIGRDMRAVFKLWGITVSADAEAQVAAYNLPAAAQLFFPMNDLASSGSGVGQPVAMSATASYPAGY